MNQPAFLRCFALPRLALLFCGVLGSQSAMASDAPNVTGAPLVVTSGYGVYGLVLWLAADSGVTRDKDDNVTALADKTGNFILTPSTADRAPSYVSKGLNGRPVLRFDGDQSLYSPDNFGDVLNRDMTFIIVAMTTNSSIHRQQFSLYLGQNQAPHVNRAPAFLMGKEFFDGQFVGCFGLQVTRNVFLVTGESIDPTLTQATFYRNGKQTVVSGLAKEGGNARFEDLSDGVTMGAATDPACGWQGDIAEELVYDHQLTPAEMQMVWSYLSAKYGLTQTVPASSGINTNQ